MSFQEFNNGLNVRLGCSMVFLASSAAAQARIPASMRCRMST
jgi:hypothetical protein